IVSPKPVPARSVIQIQIRLRIAASRRNPPLRERDRPALKIAAAPPPYAPRPSEPRRRKVEVGPRRASPPRLTLLPTINPQSGSAGQEACAAGSSKLQR